MNFFLIKELPTSGVYQYAAWTTMSDPGPKVSVGNVVDVGSAVSGAGSIGT